MPWLYIEPGKGFPASVTNDDSNEIAMLTNYHLNTAQELPGVFSSQAQLELFITDLGGWTDAFHRHFLGG